MTTSEFKIFLKLLTVRPLSQAISKTWFIPDYSVIDSGFIRRNNITQKNADNVMKVVGNPGK